MCIYEHLGMKQVQMCVITGIKRKGEGFLFSCQVINLYMTEVEVFHILKLDDHMDHMS